MDVSIVIVNYNTKNLLKQCLSSVIDNTENIIYEIIVIDNASNDGSILMIKNTFPCVRLIESQINLGFGKANNLGIEIARGKYFFFLNSDTIFLNNALYFFFKYFEYNNKNGTIGAIGGLLLDNKKKPTLSYGEFPTIRSELRYIQRKIVEKVYKKNILNTQLNDNSFINVEYIVGADLFIPKAVIDNIGAFDPDFFMYYEETDLQKRMENSGFNRLIIDGPKIIHLEGGSVSSRFKFSYSRLSLSQKSLHIYMKKHFNGLHYLAFRLLMILLRLTIVFDRRFSFNEKLKVIGLIFSGTK